MMKLRNSLTIAALAAACLAAPAYAQSNNSQASGFNSSNSLIPTSGGPTFSTTTVGYSSTILQQSQTYVQQIASARAALNAFRPAFTSKATGLRSFIRNGSSNEVTNNSEISESSLQERAQLQAALDKAQADADAFLASVKNPSGGQLSSGGSGSAGGNVSW
jgi:hypothetical protein